MTATVAAPPVTAAGAIPRVRPGEWAIVAYAGGLLVLGLSNVSGFYWTPKAALLLVALVPGLVALTRLVAARERAAIAAAAFLGISALATVLSPSPLLSLVGLYIESSSLLFVAALLGSWALGRGLSAPAARVLGSVVIAAGVANAVMAWLQMSSSFAGGMFDKFDGRAPALLGNPVHATAFLVGAFALAVERLQSGDALPRGARVGYLAAAALFASGVQLSGGRTGLVLLALVGLRALLRIGWRTTAILAVVGAVGVLAASATFTSDTGAASRLASSGGSSIDGRLDRWRTALPAIEARPMLGIGPGLYRRATSPHSTVAAARAFGPDTLYQDGHNLVVQYAVTTGLLGLAALACWLALAGIGVRGELVWFVLFAGLSLLLQPEFVGLTPVLALALGAASTRPAVPPGRGSRPVVIVGLVLGLVAAVALVRADRLFDQAARRRTATAAHRAEDALPMWPEPAAFTAHLEHTGAATATGTAARALETRAVRAALRAVRRDPSAPGSWLLLGALEADAGHRAAATSAYRRALHWNPQSTTAFDALAGLAAERGDRTAVRRWCGHLRQVYPKAPCPSRRP
jgi:O-antigen ligase